MIPFGVIMFEKRPVLAGYKHGNIPIWKQFRFLDMSYEDFEWIKTLNKDGSEEFQIQLDSGDCIITVRKKI